jgi:lycopene beta-cyclase
MAAVDRYQYLLLMAGCLIVTLPLEFVFGARVWRSPGGCWSRSYPR